MIPPIKPNETSLAVVHLHLIMQLLQLPLDAKEVHNKTAGRATQKSLMNWQKEQGLSVRDGILIDSATATALTTALKIQGHLNSKLKNSVSGKVVVQNRETIGNRKLWAFDIDFKGVRVYKELKFAKQLMAAKGGFEFLGETVSLPNGFYEIRYYDWMFSKSERKRADVVVFSIEGDHIIGHSLLVQPKERYAQNVEVTITLPSKTKGEYKHIHNQITAYLKENSGLQTNTTAFNLVPATSNLTSDELAFISGELDIPLDKILTLVRAHTMSNATKYNLEPELLYGLGRQQIALEWEQLQKTDAELLTNALDKAITEKDIDSFKPKAIQEFIAALQTAATDLLLTPQDNTPNIAAEVLQLSLPKKEEQLAFIKALTSYRGSDAKDFWNTYLPKQTKFTKAKIASIQEDQEFFGISGAFVPMTQLLKKKKAKPRQLVRWTPKMWEELVKETGVPKQIKGKNKTEKQANYIESLQNKVGLRFPTATLSHKVLKKIVPIESNEVRKEVGTFLGTATDFDIKTSSIKNYEQQITNGITDPQLKKQLLSELYQLQRLVRINPDTSLIPALLENKLTSATEIALRSKPAFIRQFSTVFGGEINTLKIYNSSAQIAAEVTLLEEGIRTHLDPYIPSIILTREQQEALIPAVAEKWPGYSKVFNLQLCECKHCNSVYSPSAYFVDLMRFLELGEKTGGKSPLDIFQERRPDLFHLPLTCENSNTLIPYIDLANEVIENYIYFTEDPDTNFQNYQSADTGSLTEEELRAQPQNIQKKVYQDLAEATYPMTLPYHYPLDILSIYSNQLGSSWYEILKTVNGALDEASAKENIRLAYLNMSVQEKTILTDGSSANLHTYFGLERSSDLRNLIKLPKMLEQTGLKYTDLLSIFKTEYINPGIYNLKFLDELLKETDLGAKRLYDNLDAYATAPTSTELLPLIEEAVTAMNGLDISAFQKWLPAHFDSVKETLTFYEPSSACDISNTSIRSIEHLHTSDDAATFRIPNRKLTKLYTFIRLWQKLEWSVYELDVILKSLNADIFNASGTNKISFAKELIDQTGLSPIKAASLWSTINPWGDHSLYASLFLNPTLEIPEIFYRLTKTEIYGDPEGDESSIGVYSAFLMSVFQLEEGDLVAIYSDVGIISASEGSLNLENLSTIYRYVWVAEITGLSVLEIIQYKQLFKITFYETANPEVTLKALEAFEKIKSIDFSIEELAYVLQNDSTSVERLIWKEDVELEKWQKELSVASLTTQLELSADALIAVEEIDIESLKTNDFISFKNEIINLHRAALVINRFDLTVKEIAYLKANTIDFDGLDFSELTVATFWRLYNYNTLKVQIPDIGDGLIQIFEVAKNSSSIAAVEEAINSVTPWNPSDIATLVRRFNSPTDYFNEVILLQWNDQLSLSKNMGIRVSALNQLAQPNSTDASGTSFDKLWLKSQYIQQLTKAKYGFDRWTKVATKLNDSLREKRRDALVGYLLAQELTNEGIAIKDANALYEFFLLDVQMSACMDTSRIVQASAAVQQFVNRSYLNLEPRVALDALDRNQWTWRKNYRVWEAQMKTLYQNSNYLNPEWRFNKSPFFKSLESYLTQNDITERTAEEAIRAYLKSMDDVSNVNIAGMYEEKYEEGDRKGQLKLLHVFGHTQHTPYTYYYRTYNEFGKWSAWEKIDAAIQAVSYADAESTDKDKKTGVHLIPIVWKNRLILFWPEFMEKTKAKATGSDNFEALAERPVKSRQPEKYWEVRLAWSEYYDKKWTAKKVSENFYSVYENSSKNGFAQITPNKLSFHSHLDEEIQELVIYQTPFIADENFTESINEHGIPYPAFRISNLSDTFQIVNYKSEFPISVEGSFIEIFVLGLAGAGSLSEGLHMNHALWNKAYANNFQKTKKKNSNLEFNTQYLKQAEHQLIFPNQLREKDIPNTYPFFYTSANRNYFIKQKYQKEAKQLLESAIDELGFLGGIILGGIAAAGLSQVLEFNSFHHPYVSNFISNLNKNGISSSDTNRPGLMESDISTSFEDGIFDDYGEYFTETFEPNLTSVYQPETILLNNPLKTFYKETIDFDKNGANSIYNWELFFHTPLQIATELSKNGKYEEALKWFHYIFNPTTDEKVGRDNELARFWKVKPLRIAEDNSFESFLNSLEVEMDAKKEVISEWRDNPFNPHLIAESFPANYKKYVVLAYVQNLIEWGDHLFRRFTRENVYEAIQMYVIASHILGPKPEFVPKRGTVKKETFATLRDKLNDLSNARVELENGLGYSSDFNDIDGEVSDSLSGTGLGYFFCVPPNEKLLHYWETVEDRLFKIRNCKDINGVARRLALFAPPIDPAALIAAKSKGMELDEILSGLTEPSPKYRFMYLLQKANEFCNDVKNLGSQLLSVLEKKDGEALSSIRATHEVGMLTLIRQIKERQVLEAREAKGQLEQQRETSVFRFKYYNETLLGNEPIEIAEINELEIDLDVNSTIIKNPPIQDILPDVDISLVDGSEEGLKISAKENQDLQIRKTAAVLNSLAFGSETTASIAALFPTTAVKGQPLGVGAGVAWGGQNIAFGAQMLAKALQTTVSILNQEAAISSTNASYIRREQDWTLQANLAAKEVQQLERQILMAGIRIQVAEKDLENHSRQIENAEQIENYISTKFTNLELYNWMKEQLISLHKQSFDLAHKLASQAEMAFQFEKGGLNNTYITYDYSGNSKFGLLAGEKLQLALRQLEIAYQEKNTREFELTKHISLRRLSPLQLLQLKASGKITDLQIPEWIFDLDCPGHYNRKIKRVGISIPAIAGPYTNVSCTLALKSSYIRINPDLDSSSLGEAYGAVNSIVTSTAQNDDGMFETNFRDERYLPFEGAGVISTWDLELPGFKQFDYNSISDIIIHISYTAEENEAFTTIIMDKIKEELADYMGDSFYEIVNLKHDFSNEWHRFISSEDANFEADLTNQHFPYFASTKVREIVGKKIYSISTEGTLDPNGIADLSGNEMRIEIKRDDLNQTLESFVAIEYKLS